MRLAFLPPLRVGPGQRWGVRGWEEGALGEVRLDGAPGLGRGRVAPVLLSVGRELLVGPEHPPVCPAPSNCCCTLPCTELAF